MNTHYASVDAHVHFYTSEDLATVEGQLPYSPPAPHSLSDYLDTMEWAPAACSHSRQASSFV